MSGTQRGHTRCRPGLSLRRPTVSRPGLRCLCTAGTWEQEGARLQGAGAQGGPEPPPSGMCPRPAAAEAKPAGCGTTDVFPVRVLGARHPRSRCDEEVPPASPSSGGVRVSPGSWLRPSHVCLSPRGFSQSLCPKVPLTRTRCGTRATLPPCDLMRTSHVHQDDFQVRSRSRFLGDVTFEQGCSPP